MQREKVKITGQNLKIITMDCPGKNDKSLLLNLILAFFFLIFDLC
jgi:hypothetical protein